MPGLPDVRGADERDYLSPRERVGVRGKGASAPVRTATTLPEPL